MDIKVLCEPLLTHLGFPQANLFLPTQECFIVGTEAYEVYQKDGLEAMLLLKCDVKKLQLAIKRFEQIEEQVEKISFIS